MGGEKPAPYDSYEPATLFCPLFNTEFKTGPKWCKKSPSDQKPVLKKGAQMV